MSKKILLIESDGPLAGTIAGALQRRGVEVALAHDANSAVDLARSEKPDGIVLCAELSGGSGFVVCNRIRKDPDLRGIPLLLTSAEATEDTFTQHQKLKTRADAYLHKPFDLTDLLVQLGGIAELPAPVSRDDDDDLQAFDAAFDSIANAAQVPLPVEHPVSAEDADAAAALLADLVDAGEPRPGPAAVEQRHEPYAVELEPLLAEQEPVALPERRQSDDSAELESLRSRLESMRRELEAARSELQRAQSTRATLEQSLASEKQRAVDAETRIEAAAALHDEVRRALHSALALLGDRG